MKSELGKALSILQEQQSPDMKGWGHAGRQFPQPLESDTPGPTRHVYIHVHRDTSGYVAHWRRLTIQRDDHHGLG